jgi:hypothetical protein
VYSNAPGLSFGAIAQTLILQPAPGIVEHFRYSGRNLRHLAPSIGQKPLQSVRAPNFRRGPQPQEGIDLVGVPASHDYQARAAGIDDLLQQIPEPGIRNGAVPVN